MRRLPDDVIAALAKTTKEVLEAEAAADPLATEVYASIQTYVAKANFWTDLQHIPESPDGK